MSLLVAGKAVGAVVGKVAFNLMKVGAWGVAQQYTQEQFRSNSRGFITEAERGADHVKSRVKLVVRNDKK